MQFKYFYKSGGMYCLRLENATLHESDDYVSFQAVCLEYYLKILNVTQ